MKLTIALFVLTVILVGTVLAGKDRKGDKKEWREKKGKLQQKYLAKKKKHPSEDVAKENKMDYNKKGVYDIDNPVEYKGVTKSVKSHKKKHFGKKKAHKKSKKQSKKQSSGKRMKKVHKAMSWLDIQSDADCEFKCTKLEVCISGPVVDKPICVHKKDLKKSMKMFHQYHKKEMKEWRKYQKKHYKNDWKLKKEKYGKKSKKLTKEEIAKYEKMAKKLKDERDAMKKEKRVKLGKGQRKHQTFHKKAKPSNVHPKTKEPVCGVNEMNQMKTRMMGWFHLLHGQDHEARKAHGGSLGKFYKHVSVKKELRENNGEKCQCMKSAMWQFSQMDKNDDDHLIDTELSMLAENTLEPCMKPYLDTCDKDGDKKINSDEWCCCFTNVLPPCYNHLNEIRKAGKPVTYMPRCDKEGYYMHEQCKGGDASTPLTCWCVDYNGNEYTDTVSQGRAHCHKIAKYGYKQSVPFA